MLDLQAELEAARAIEKSLMDVHAALAELDGEGRRAVLIRALAALDVEIKAEAPPADDLCPKCQEREIAYRRKWCAVCAATHAAKTRAGKKKADAGSVDMSDRAKKRREERNGGSAPAPIKAEHDAPMPTTERHPSLMVTANEPKDDEPDLDREIVERSIMDAVKDGSKDLFTITKAVWGVATISLQRRAKKILWAMKYDGVLRQDGDLYGLA